MQRLLVAIAVVVVAHSAIVIGQANMCVAPPQIPDVLRKFQLTILSYFSTRTKLIIWASVSKLVRTENCHRLQFRLNVVYSVGLHGNYIQDGGLT